MCSRVQYSIIHTYVNQFNNRHITSIFLLLAGVRVRSHNPSTTEEILDASNPFLINVYFPLWYRYSVVTWSRLTFRPPRYRRQQANVSLCISQMEAVSSCQRWLLFSGKSSILWVIRYLPGFCPSARSLYHLLRVSQQSRPTRPA